MKSVGEALGRLEANASVVDIQRLSEDEAFITLVLNTTRIALQSHAREKLDATAGGVAHPSQRARRVPRDEPLDIPCEDLPF